MKAFFSKQVFIRIRDFSVEAVDAIKSAKVPDFTQVSKIFFLVIVEQ